MDQYLHHDLHALLPGRGVASRRHALGLVLGAGYAAAAAPVLAQQAIATPVDGLVAGEVSFAVNGAQVYAYRAAPQGRTGLPVVLVVSEIFGVHEHIADVCRRLAQAGYLAIAPDLFARQGDPMAYAEMAKLMSEVISKVPDAQVMGDLDAAVQWAGANGGDTSKLAITGFCWGGRISWLYAAHNPQLRAAVAWYGRLTGVATGTSPKHPADLISHINAPVLGLYGAKDQGIPVSDVEDMREDMARAGKRAEFVIYPEAGHAFHADYRPSYRAEDAIDGWARMLAWFRDKGD